ncbi:hypothetical protein FB446DRAFT_735282 [Lentinula raphanica]|nr:hypothetical protein FB446DRAFT_735282 [Lentinula raphanica]
MSPKHEHEMYSAEEPHDADDFAALQLGKMYLQIERLKSRLADTEKENEDFRRENQFLKNENNILKREYGSLQERMTSHISGRTSTPPPQTDVVVISDDDDEDFEMVFKDEKAESNNRSTRGVSSTKFNIKNVQTLSPNLETIDTGRVTNKNLSSPPRKRQRLSLDSRDTSHGRIDDANVVAIHQSLQTISPNLPVKASNLTQSRCDDSSIGKPNNLQPSHQNLPSSNKFSSMSAPTTISRVGIASFQTSSSNFSSAQSQRIACIRSCPSTRLSDPHTRGSAENTTPQLNRAIVSSPASTPALDTHHTTVQRESSDVATSAVSISSRVRPSGLFHLAQKRATNDVATSEPRSITKSSPSNASSASQNPASISAPVCVPSVVHAASVSASASSSLPSSHSACSSSKNPSLNGTERENAMKPAQPSGQEATPQAKMLSNVASKNTIAKHEVRPIVESTNQPALAGPSNSAKQDDRNFSDDGKPARRRSKKHSSLAPQYSLVPAIQALDPVWVEAVSGFLRDTPSFRIDPSPDLNFRVARLLLGQKYKVSTGSFLAIIKPDLNPSSTPDNPHARSIIFPFYEENPDLPTRPGEPGIMLTKRTDILASMPVTVFINHAGRGKSPSVWLYTGEYTLKKIAEMTGDQFSRQPLKTQERWGNSILTLKQDNVWASMRARIYLRKQNLPLTNENVAEEQARIQARDARPGPLDVQDVIDAFVRGEERLDILRMECVAYDHVFVDDLKPTAMKSLKGVPEPEVQSALNDDHAGSGLRASSSSGTPLRRSTRERRPAERFANYLELDFDSMSDLTDSEEEYDMC